MVLEPSGPVLGLIQGFEPILGVWAQSGCHFGPIFGGLSQVWEPFGPILGVRAWSEGQIWPILGGLCPVWGPFWAYFSRSELSLWPFGAILGVRARSEDHSGPILGVRDRSGAIWTYCKGMSPVWGPFWAYSRFQSQVQELFWAHYGPIGPIWAFLGSVQSGPIGPISGHFWFCPQWSEKVWISGT